jgi:glycosyltransferase XagB
MTETELQERVTAVLDRVDAEVAQRRFGRPGEQLRPTRTPAPRQRRVARAVIPAVAAPAPVATPALPQPGRRRPPRRWAPRPSAQLLLTGPQAVILLVALVLWIGAVVLWPVEALRLTCGAALAFWTLMIGLKALVAIAAHRSDGSDRRADVTDPDLPRFTILVPLYKEANMVVGLREALGALRYPADLVQVLALLEEDDDETIAAATQHGLPFHVVPPGGPRSKPNALNSGLEQATGELVVVYDAEDRPDPDQLLLFAQAFRDDTKGELGCVQARLAFWNGDSSWVARFYWVEYVVHFEWVLRGLTRLNLVPPLGGTSNCFPARVLRQMDGWDAWNVTEDADLAGALALRRLRVGMIDSVTWEEAPKHLKVAMGQRSRWLKGYLHTGLAFAREPLKKASAMGWKRYLAFQLLMLGTPLSILLTPVFWATTIAYFVTRSSFIESLFPGPLLLYAGALLLLAGNLLVFFQRVWACVHRQGEGGVKTMLLFPVWELVTFAVLLRVVNELARPKLRHRWVKTEHGHDSAREAAWQAARA